MTRVPEAPRRNVNPMNYMNHSTHVHNTPARPRLITERLTLRRCLAEDSPWLAALATDETVMRYIPPGPMDEDKARIWARARIAEDRGCTLGLWAIEEQRNRAFSGIVGLQVVSDAAEIELVCRLLPAAWGRGIGTESCRRLAAHGFVDVGLNRIALRVHAKNTAAHKVAQKLGFQYVGPWPSQSMADCQLYRLNFSTWRDMI